MALTKVVIQTLHIVMLQVVSRALVKDFSPNNLCFVTSFPDLSMVYLVAAYML